MKSAPPLTKQQAAYHHLRERILQGHLPPGHRLVIGSLAAQLHMSPIPVREALSLLQREGLVTVRPHAGASVSEVSLRSIEEIFALLEQLETLACRLLPQPPSGALITELTACADAMQKARSAPAWRKLNRQFHEATSRHADLPLVTEFLVRTGENWERLRRLRFGHMPVAERTAANTEHRQFIELLAAGDRRGQQQWILQHNRRALERYLAHRAR